MISRAQALQRSPPSRSTSSSSAAASRARAWRSTPPARGYSVALVEKADFASGTSSRSSKLVHGGLRYLQNFDLGLVREALLERQLMVKLAPHLVKPLPLVVPAFDGQRPDRLVGDGAEPLRRDGGRQAAPPPQGRARRTTDVRATGARSATA